MEWSGRSALLRLSQMYNGITDFANDSGVVDDHGAEEEYAESESHPCGSPVTPLFLLSDFSVTPRVTPWTPL